MVRKAQETLAILMPPQADMNLGLAYAIRLQVLCLSAVCAAVSVTSVALAQPEVIRCLAPEVPITDLPAAVLLEYRAEITAEFETYFADLSAHIACLDAERSRALSEAHIATEAYSAFLNTPPAQKDLP